MLATARPKMGAYRIGCLATIGDRYDTLEFGSGSYLGERQILLLLPDRRASRLYVPGAVRTQRKP